MTQNALRLTHGMTHGPNGLEPACVGIEQGRFAEGTGAREIRVDGLWLLPGIVDLHGDGFERHLAPRRGVVRDLTEALPYVEAELLACGVTTAWLAQFWSWEGGMRGPDFAARLAEALTRYRPRARLDLRMQLRLETHMFEDRARIEALIAAHDIDYVVFNDHLPHNRLAAGRTPPRLVGSASKAGRSPADHEALMQALHRRSAEVPGFVGALGAWLAARGVCLGSHDDADAAARANWAALGLDISEFPLSRAAAEAAQGPVVMGAPNIVRGGSHNRGGLSAEMLIAGGKVTALASDYHYPSLAGAVRALDASGTLDFAQGWRLISEFPAQAMGLADRGRIAPGLRADLVVYDPEMRQICGTFVAGEPVWLSGRLAQAL